MKNLALLLIILSPFGVHAENPSVSIGASTFGLTITPEYKINDSIGVRLPIGTASLSGHHAVEDAFLKATGTIGGAGLVADYYPWRGLRFSSGLVMPLYKIRATGSSEVNLDGSTFNIDNFSSTISSDNIAPMLGVGYKFNHLLNSNFYGAVDLGAIMNVNYSGEYSYSGLRGSAQDIFETEADSYLSDALNDLNNDANILPFVSIAVGYRF